MSSIPSAAGSPRTFWLPIAILFLSSAIIYCRVVHFEFVAWDDDRMLYENPHVQAITAANVHWMFTDASYNKMYMPLGWLQYALSFALFANDAGGHHLINLGLHFLNSVLVFLVLRQVLGGESREGGESMVQTTGIWAPFLGALFWSIHPLRVEVVAWVGARGHAIAAFFILGASWCYLHAAGDRPALMWRRLGFWLSVVLYVLSLLVFPAGLAFPLVLLVLDIYVLKRYEKRCRWPDVARVVWEKAPFFLVIALPLAVSLWGRLHGHLLNPSTGLAHFGVLSRLMQACYVVAYLLWVEVVPLGLSPVYTRLIQFDPFESVFLASFGFLVGMTILTFYFRKRVPAVFAAWLCHLLIIIPFLGLTQHPHYASDRYSYLDGVVWSALLAGGLQSLARGRSIGFLRGGVATVVILTAGTSALAYRQVGLWSDSVTLFRGMIAAIGDNPQSAGIYARLSRSLLEQGHASQALEASNGCLQVAPDDAMALESKAAACNQLAEAARGEHRPSAEIIDLYRQAAGASDHLAAIDSNVRSLLLAGFAYGQMSRFSEAEDRLLRAVGMAPNDAPAHLALGRLYWMEGRQEKAEEEFRQAVALAPHLALQHAQIVGKWSTARPLPLADGPATTNH